MTALTPREACEALTEPLDLEDLLRAIPADVVLVEAREVSE